MKIQCESCKKDKEEKDIVWDLREDREICKGCAVERIVLDTIKSG